MYKVIIADDEEIERQALEMMIKRNFYNLEVVPSAETGIELMAQIEKYQPDIAIVDINMPGINGLEALGMIQSRHKKMKIIIQSAYSDFQYGQQALTLGVTEYLLKPVTSEELTRAVKKACEIVEEELQEEVTNCEIMKLSKEMREIAGSQLLSSFLLKDPDERSFSIYCKAANHEFCGGIFLSVYIRTEKQDMHWEKRGTQKLEQLRQILETTLHNYAKCLTRIYKETIVVLVLPEKHVNKEDYKKWIENLYRIIMKSAKEKLQCSLTMGVSQWKETFLLLQSGVQECLLAGKEGREIGIYFWNERPSSMLVEEDHSEVVKRIAYFIKHHMKEEMILEEEQLFCRFQERHRTLAQKIFVCTNLLAELLDELQSVHPAVTLYRMENKIDWKHVLQSANDENLYTCFHNYLIQIEASVSRPEEKWNEYVERTLLYLEAHYQEDITLDMAAENVGITSFYLSRLLRQELDQTFVEILTDIRIRKALEFLKNRQKTIKDVAVATGYSNITYFYKVFKKYVGLSIGEYRELL